MPVPNVAAGAPITEAWGDAVADSVNALEAADASHAAAVNPHPNYATDTDLTSHAGASDPHAGYRLESANHSHASSGAEGGTIAHSALTGLTAGDPHTQYQQESEKGQANGYAGLGADGKVPSAQLPAAGAAAAIPARTVYASGSGNWTKPAGCRAVDVELIGGGGGGGGVPTNTGGYNVSGGGAGGGYVRKLYDATALGATVAYAVGAGGTAGSTAGGTGGTGGTSSFGAGGTLISATGGTGGLGDTTMGTGGRDTAGGTGGVGSGGDINLTGSDGTSGAGSSNNAGAHAGSGGAAPMLSAVVEGGPVTLNLAAKDGRAYGGGGSGAANNNSNALARVGGIGAAGAVIVTAYF